MSGLRGSGIHYKRGDMTITVPTTEPTEIRAGDFVTWKKSLTDYPATSWLLEYFLVKSDNQIGISATASGTDHLVSEAATDTKDWSAGEYHYIARVTKNTEIYTIKTGSLEILPDFETQTSGYDDRSFAKTCLDAIEAILEGKASEDVYSYSIGGRSLSKFSHAELLDARDRYRAEYNAEEIKAGRKSGKIKTRFV